MGVMVSQITSPTIVYSTVYSGAYQRKHQSSASLAFVRGIHRWPVNSPHKGPVAREIFLFDDVIMISRRLPAWGHPMEAAENLLLTGLTPEQPTADPDVFNNVLRGLLSPSVAALTHTCQVSPDSKVHGANMGPIWGRQNPCGPHVGPMNFAIWVGKWL